jgi:Lar family restriction alleviation protein
MTTPTQSDEELKPCPFCGGKAIFVRTGARRHSCIVSCESCGCRHESSDTYDLSGTSWNTRYAEQELEAVKREYWEMGVTECVEELNKTESDATWILPNESRESTLALVKWLRDNLIRLKQSNQAQGGE